MSPHRSRFVTACQQLLALAVVLAVLTPAAGVVSLDVVGSAPQGSHTGTGLPAGGHHVDVRRAGAVALSADHGRRLHHVGQTGWDPGDAVAGASLRSGHDGRHLGPTVTPPVPTWR